MQNKSNAGSPATSLLQVFSCFQSSHGKRRTTQLRRARRRLAARSSFALTSVKAVGQSLRVLLLDVPLSSSAEELEGQTPEKAEKRQTEYQHYVARFCLNSLSSTVNSPAVPGFGSETCQHGAVCVSLSVALSFQKDFALYLRVSLLQRWWATSTRYKPTASTSFFPGRMREDRGRSLVTW